MSTSPTHPIHSDDPFRSLMHITSRPPQVMMRGDGSELWDAQGKRYLDFVQGWAVNTLGHCPPAIQAALSLQASTLIHPAAAFHNQPQLHLADMLSAASALDRVFFCNSGAEANEGAIKLARKWGQLHKGGAFEVITTIGSFHGRTLATMAASGKPGFAARFPPSMPGFKHVPYDDLAAIDAAITADTVAVMLEPIQGEAGVVVPSPGYLHGLRALTHEHGLLLIADEVQTGVGRTGTLFAHTQEGITPDIMTLGKGLGGGVPLAALLCSQRTACFEAGDQGGTFNGNPLMTAVGLAVMQAVSAPGFLENANQTAHLLRQGLERVARTCGASCRGRGLLQAMVLPLPAAASARDRCMHDGLLINAPQANVLRFMPALNVGHEEVQEMLRILERALSQTMAQCTDPSVG